MEALLPLAGLVRSISTPEFSGVTFHEVTAKSVLNKVPSGSAMPFEWTVNPYRGCSHACVYCFARKSHTYLEFDAGRDFDSPGGGQDQRRGSPAQGTGQAFLATTPGCSWHQHGPLSKGRRPLCAHAGNHPGIGGFRNTILHPDQRHPACPGHPPAQARCHEVPVDLGISLAMTNEDLAGLVVPGTPSTQGTAQTHFPAPGSRPGVAGSWQCPSCRG